MQPPNTSPTINSVHAFEALFDKHYWPVRDFVRRRAPDSAVEDVVSETFLVAWRRFADLAGDPLPWLLGIARRVLANQLRGDRRRQALLSRLDHTWSRADENWESPSDLDGGLMAALGRLSAREQEVLLIVAWDGLDSAHAAQVLGCSIPAFRVRLHRARRRMAKELTDGRMPTINLTKESSPS